MVRFLKFYFGVALVVLVVNIIRYVRCSMYQNTYNSNFIRNTPSKNFYIQPSIIPLLRRGNVALQNPNINVIADDCYRRDFNNAFESAKGYFRHCAIYAPLWFILAIESLTIFTLANKLRNNFVRIMFGLFQFFANYLVLLYLDTSGIGYKILNVLLAFLTESIERLAVYFC